MEAAGLGAFMVSASLFGTLLEHPASPVRAWIAFPSARRALMGIAMGLTAIAIIRSPWGRRSGAHINPATTLTFWRLGKVAPADALTYVAAQFLGAAGGMGIAALLLPGLLSDPAVNWVATLPGPWGLSVALGGELLISFVMMLVVLIASNSATLSRHTAVLAGALVALFITFEAPLSGMSLNPARSFGSALAAGDFSSLWIYFTAPPLGMLAAAEVFVRTRGMRAVHCAKLDHHNSQPCIFRCRFGALLAQGEAASGASPGSGGKG